MTAATIETEHAAPASTWSGLQILVVGLCFLLNMLDGADLLVMSFVAPELAAQWSVSPESLGVIFSASLAGMAIGCLVVAPLGDRFGRKPMILIALALVAVSMIASGYATGVAQLIVARLLVGIGVGTIGVSMSAMAGEYAPPGRSAFAVGLVQAGFPLAAVITAFAAVWAIPQFGWQSLLVGIGALSVVLFAIVLLIMPESMAFLQSRQPVGALQRLNSLRERMGDAPLAALPPSQTVASKFSIAALLADGRARPTFLLWLATISGFFVLYFVLSWIPKLSNQAGLPVDQAIYAGASFNAGAFLGTALVGWLTVRFKINHIIALSFVGAAISMMVFSGVSMPLVVTLAVAVLVGAFVNGGFNGFWSLAALLYPADIRATGIGWAFGVGRIGAVLGPIVGGFLVGADLPISTIFAVYTVAILLCGGICLLIVSPRDHSGS